MRALWLMVAGSLLASPVFAKSGDGDVAHQDAVAHSPVRNQHSVGFCWAYTATGFAEAERLRRGLSRVELSPEYVGFYHMFFD